MTTKRFVARHGLDANSQTVTNVGSPIDPGDAVPISWLTNKIPSARTVISFDDLDTLMTEGYYRLDNAAGYFANAPIEVVPIPSGSTYQIILSHLYRVYVPGSGWSDFKSFLTTDTVEGWYTATTVEAPNAVINNDGTFSRSVSKVVTSSAASSSDGELPVFDGLGGGTVRGSGKTISSLQNAITFSPTAPTSPSLNDLWIQI